MSIKAENLRRERNRPPADEPWVWFTREMLESEALQSLSRAARLVVDRIMIEHMAHAGTENGNLAVTYDDFARFGIRRQSVMVALDDLTACGLIIVTVKGRASVGEDRWPARYALGWLPMFDGTPARNRWKTWKKPCPLKAPPCQDIDSRCKNAPRENGRNTGPLGAETHPAPRCENAPGEPHRSASP